MTEYIIEPRRKIPIIASCDLCIIGGSCTGVFAAVRASRMGLRVVLVEKQNMLGGTATLGLVNLWHSLYDTDRKNQIISGLTEEMIKRLRKKGVLKVFDTPDTGETYKFNPWELSIELDKLIKENKITVLLHTSYAAVIKEDNRVSAVIVENSDGRGAVSADFFIDASGDGRVARGLGIKSYIRERLQPPTSCFHMQGQIERSKIGGIIKEHGKEFGLGDDWGWSSPVVDTKDITIRADNHIFGLRLDRADDLTEAEFEGRRLADGFVSMLRKYGEKDENYAITALCSQVGIRETVHYKTRFQADGMSLLCGKKYKSPVLCGTYRVDIHHSEDNGITFMYLGGEEKTIWGKDTKFKLGNWRERLGVRGEPSKYYQVPFDILVCEEYENFIPVGRMINADEGAFGALRVMTNLNQLGEAAGTAAALCMDLNVSVSALRGEAVTEALKKGGSAL